MPDIKPFRAIVYGAAHRKNIRSLVCPPYDVISPEGREALVARDPLNFVRVELPAGDAETRYETARALWGRWLDHGVLRRESSPVFYVYESRFRSPWTTAKRSSGTTTSPPARPGASGGI
jgi:uncharacterized protein (DUF1015 family)